MLAVVKRGDQLEGFSYFSDHLRISRPNLTPFALTIATSFVVIILFIKDSVIMFLPKIVRQTRTRKGRTTKWRHI